MLESTYMTTVQQCSMGISSHMLHKSDPIPSCTVSQQLCPPAHPPALAVPVSPVLKAQPSPPSEGSVAFC